MSKSSSSQPRSPASAGLPATLAMLSLAALESVAVGQQVIHEWTSTYDFGHAVCAGVDFDQDGRADVAIGRPNAKYCGGTTGAVLVHSGATGAVLHQLQDVQFASGFDVQAAGDVDGDGRTDLVQVAPDNFADCPYFDLLRVHSAAGGQVVMSYLSTTSGFDDLAASGIGDLDGDGKGDVAFGNATSGAVHVLSGANGSPLFSATASAGFGSDVTGLGDLDLDGKVDHAVGDRLALGRGAVWLYSGTGALIVRVDGLTTGEWFGEAIDGLGDVDQDGHPDLIAGAPRAAPSGADSGSARFVSGLALGVTASFDGGAAGDRFGHDVSRQLDFDGDGVTDLAIGSLGDYARIVSGASFQPIATLLPDSLPGRFGFAVDGSGDVDGDGLGDLVIGSPAGSGEPSGARVVSHCAGAATSFGAGCAGAGGFVPRLALEGCPQAGRMLTLRLEDTLGHTTALLLFGAAPGALPLPNGCTLLVAPLLPLQLVLPITGGGAGGGSLAVSATLPMTVPSGSFTMQAFVVDPVAPGGYAATGGLLVAIP
jgi:hypothetical protein